MNRRWASRAALLGAGALAIWLAGRGLDQTISMLFYDPVERRFPWRDAWALSRFGHDGLKWIMVSFWAGCLIRKETRRGALLMAAAAICVALLKHSSPYSCPWDLAAWGGGAQPPGPGRCSPAGHPAVGFALFGLYFALLPDRPAAARTALAAAWVIGLAAGAVQIARGAHFASHVLWTAWVAWAVTQFLALVLPAHPMRRPT